MVYRPSVQSDLCFVLLPISQPFLKTYEEIIRPAAKSAGLNTLHAKEIYGVNAIISDIWEHIWRAKIVIADVSGRNPNVNYELGICHTLGVPTLLITKDIEDVPFDYRHRRVVIYQQENPKWGDELQRDIERSIRAMLDGDTGSSDLAWPYEARALPADGADALFSSGPAARRAVISGMEVAAAAVASAYGPTGSRVWKGERGSATRNGLMIVRGLSALGLADVGLRELERAADEMNRRVGDGRKLVMILTAAMVREAQTALDEGFSRSAVLAGMDRALTNVIDRIRRDAKPLAGNAVAQVAATAGCELELAELISDALEKSGKDGVITIEAGDVGTRSSVVVADGTEFDRGFVSSRFATDAGQADCVLEDVAILWFEGKISFASELVALMEQAARAGRSLLVVASAVEGEALATMIVNNEKGTLRCCAVRAPGSGNGRAGLLQDFAVATGGTAIVAESGRLVEAVKLSELGRAERAVVGKDRTAIFNGAGTPEAVRSRVNQLRSEISIASDSERASLQERLARLGGAIAVVRVGGRTEGEIAERRQRAIAALNSVFGAIEQGEVLLIASVYFHLSNAIVLDGLPPGELEGAAIVARCLQRPLALIAKSNGDVLDTVRLRGEKCGFDAVTGEVRELRVAGLLDPARTAREALQVAFWRARGIIETDTWDVVESSAEQTR